MVLEAAQDTKDTTTLGGVGVAGASVRPVATTKRERKERDGSCHHQAEVDNVAVARRHGRRSCWLSQRVSERRWGEEMGEVRQGEEEPRGEPTTTGTKTAGPGCGQGERGSHHEFRSVRRETLARLLCLPCVTCLPSCWVNLSCNVEWEGPGEEWAQRKKTCHVAKKHDQGG